MADRKEEERAMARCQVCGAELEDARRFCGGDRCARVFMTMVARPAVATRGAVLG
jgi:hypothetical protein